QEAERDLECGRFVAANEDVERPAIAAGDAGDQLFVSHCGASWRSVLDIGHVTRDSPAKVEPALILSQAFDNPDLIHRADLSAMEVIGTTRVIRVRWILTCFACVAWERSRLCRIVCHDSPVQIPIADGSPFEKMLHRACGAGFGISAFPACYWRMIGCPRRS